MNKERSVLGRGLASILSGNNTNTKNISSKNEQNSNLSSIGSTHHILISQMIENLSRRSHTPSAQCTDGKSANFTMLVISRALHE